MQAVPCTSPAITDFVYQVDGASHMFITGPDVIKAVTGEEVTFEELGGAETHASLSGVTHFIAESGPSALDEVRFLLSFLPQNNMELPPYFTPSDSPDRSDDSLDSIIPDSPNQPYDMVSIIESVVDDGEFYQVHQQWAQNIVVGLARLNGHSIGIVANQPAHLAGTLNITASRESGTIRSNVRCLQHPTIHVRRRAGLPTWRRAGARWNHPSWGQASVRILRSDRPQSDSDNPQVLRRGVPRYECEGGRR